MYFKDINVARKNGRNRPICSSMELEFRGLRDMFECHALSMDMPGDMYSARSDRRLGRKHKTGMPVFSTVPRAVPSMF